MNSIGTAPRLKNRAGRKIVGRLKNTMVAGSLFSTAQALGAIGSEPVWSLGSDFVPPLLFQGLGVISRA